MKDETRIRELAKKYAEKCFQPSQRDRIVAWTALHDLMPVRPAVLVETINVKDFVAENELLTSSPEARELERWLLHNIRHIELFDDDYVISPGYPVFFNIDIRGGDYGAGLKRFYSNSGAVVSNHPIKTPDDLEKLSRRTFSYDVTKTTVKKERIDELLNGVISAFYSSAYYTLPQLSKIVYDLIGDDLYLWAYDYPEELKYLIQFVRDDLISYYRFCETGGLLSYNNCNQIAGGGSYGYTTDLPAEITKTGAARLKDMWVWSESQETSKLSPEMFQHFFISPIADISAMFGLTYYGCCEKLDDRFKIVQNNIKNIRSVSVSHWNDVNKMAEMTDGKYVFSRKTAPMFVINGLDREKIKQDVKSTIKAVKSGCVEFILRDIYDNVDVKDLQEYVAIVKNNFPRGEF